MKRFIFSIMLGLVVLASFAQSQEAPLGNADVVTLNKLELGDEVVIAKINQAPKVNFSTDTDSLVKLKENGVSKEVIAAMLKRSTAPKNVPPQWVQDQVRMQNQGRREFPTEVALSTKASDTTLQVSHGQNISFGFNMFRVQHFAFRGIKARDRTSEKLPALTFRLDFSPVERAFFVKLDESPKEDYRSFRFANRSNGAGPADGYIVDCDATEVTPGQWKLTPKAELVPGEYGLYFGAMLWAFGVEPAPTVSAPLGEASGVPPQSPTN
jgi:hypothetical protein